MKKIKSILLILVLFLTVHSLPVSAISDSTPPRVDEVKILTPTVKPGNKVTIQLKVSDDISGTKDVAFMFRSPSQNNDFHVFLFIKEYDQLTNTYIIESEPLSKYAEVGQWDLILITAKDFAGNKISFYKPIDAELFINQHFIVDPNYSNDNDDTPPYDDGFTSWKSQINVDVNKEFTITFSDDFDIKTILEKNIYVTDSTGIRVPLLFIIDRNSDFKSSTVTIAPVGSYRAASSYTLYIKDIISKSGKILNKNVKMRFTTKM